MGLNIPTTEEIKNSNLANFELALNQTSPLNSKAFLRVLASVEAMNFTALFKLLSERTKQNLAITASSEDLDRIGQEYNVIRKPAEAAVLNISLPADNGTVIPATIDYKGDSNNVRYFPDSSVIAAGGEAISDVTAETLGVIGNLNIGDTLTIGTQIAGAETTATVTTPDGIVNIGAEEETDDIYRDRVSNAIRSTTGGGNAADHKIWSEEVAGVAQAYPYAGTPSSPAPGIDVSSVPADRTVFIEADTSIDPDGIAPTALLDEVRISINNDPITGASRPPLGLVNSTLFVESIVRTTINVKITNLIVASEIEAQVKADISTALVLYFLSIQMFVTAIDLLSERNDLITDLTISDIVQDVLSVNGASAEEVSFNIGAGDLDNYQLEPGELSKLGTVSYV